MLKIQRDKRLKEKLGYTDPDTIVWEDGREKLVGDDWIRRKQELLSRSHGHCERFSRLKKMHEAFCYGWAEEPHHIIPRSKGRDDRLDNLVALSHACHSAEDKRKIGGRK